MLRNSTLRGAAQIAAAYFGGPSGAAAFASYMTMAAGGSPSDALRSGAIVYITASAFHAVGDTWPTGLGNVIGHAVVGCASSAASGGSCGSGAVAAGFPAAFAGNNIFIQSLVGGIASRLSGGNFQEGAVLGAFGYIFNHLLHYDGKTVRYYDDDGKLLGEYPATSGRNGVTDPSVRDQGPIPEGSYTLNPSEIQERSFVSRAASLVGLRADWGQYLAPLNVSPGTETFGRSGFYLHGGLLPGSAGCIDLGKYDSTLFPKLMNHSGPIRVDVKY